MLEGPEIRVEGRITSVQVYARGAVVTRMVALPALPAEAVDVVVAGLTPLADPGSVRVAVDGGREVVAAAARLVIPETPAGPGPLLERVRELTMERERLTGEREAAQWRRDQLAGAQITASLGGKERHVDPVARAQDALASARLVGEKIGALEERIAELDDLMIRTVRALEAAELAAAQGTTGERAGKGHPTRELVVRLAPGGEARGLEVSYTVPAARWWPVYAARLTEGGTRVAFAMSAVVAQASGEDWPGVALSLSTADLVRDARLPELPSLRLGRAQPSVRRGYRPPPAGLDELFRGYDVARAAAAREAQAQQAQDRHRLAEARVRPIAGPTTIVPHAPEHAAAPPPPKKGRKKADRQRAERALDDMEMEFLEEPTAVNAPPPAELYAEQAAPVQRSAAPMPQGFAAPGGFGSPPPAAMAAAPMARMAPQSYGGGAPADVTTFAAAPAPLEPADAWLDFDSLIMGGGDDGSQRGRLKRGAAEPVDAAGAVRTIESLAPPPGAQDPRSTRGEFDHSFRAQASADVPSNGRGHHVLVSSADTAGRPRFLTVPREVAEVYREVELDNPFPALLAGPVDVFVDGALVLTAPVGAVDRGGSILLGLGVEERIRVARNARVEEASAGLLGGSTVVEHTVTVDLRSSLGRPVEVELRERIPVTDDNDLDVTTSSKPVGEEYDQSDRGAPVRGGMRWKVPLAAGGKAQVELRYKLKLPGKSEVVGGNRRE
jgi:hypothetical protein